MKPPPLSSGEIKLIEEAIRDLPIGERFEVDDIWRPARGNTGMQMRIFEFFKEYDLVDVTNYANPILKDNGRKFKELDNYQKFIKWYKSENDAKNITKWITKYWWVPVIASFAFTIAWDSCKHYVWEVNDGNGQINKQETSSSLLSVPNIDSLSKDSIQDCDTVRPH